MSASEISHSLKEYGNGDEFTGVVNVFKTGVGVGVAATLITGTAIYGINRLIKWGCKNIIETSIRHNRLALNAED